MLKIPQNVSFWEGKKKVGCCCIVMWLQNSGGVSVICIVLCVKDPRPLIFPFELSLPTQIVQLKCLRCPPSQQYFTGKQHVPEVARS